MAIVWSLPPMPVIHSWETGRLTIELQQYIHSTGDIHTEAHYELGSRYAVTQPVGQGFAFPEPSYFQDDGSTDFVFTVMGSYPDWENIPQSWNGITLQYGLQGGATPSFIRVLYVGFEADPGGASPDPPRYICPPCPGVECSISTNNQRAEAILAQLQTIAPKPITDALTALESIDPALGTVDLSFPEWRSRLDTFAPFGKRETTPLADLTALMAGLDRVPDGINALATQANESLCPSYTPSVAMADWKRWRTGSYRPQLVVFYAAKDDEGQWLPGRYPITIPWGKTLPVKQPHWKGPAYGRLTLADNSKLIVNCKTVGAAKNLINQLRFCIDSRVLAGATVSYGKRPGTDIAVAKVWPKTAFYFSQGPVNPYPDWRVEL